MYDNFVPILALSINRMGDLGPSVMQEKEVWFSLTYHCSYYACNCCIFCEEQKCKAAEEMLITISLCV